MLITGETLAILTQF